MMKKISKPRKEKSEVAFYAPFGAFASEKSPEELVKEIKASRKFRKKEIKF